MPSRSLFVTVTVPSILRCALGELHSGPCQYEHSAARPALIGQCLKTRVLEGKNDILQAWRVSEAPPTRKMRVFVEQLAPVTPGADSFFCTSIENALASIAESVVGMDF